MREQGANFEIIQIKTFNLLNFFRTFREVFRKNILRKIYIFYRFWTTRGKVSFLKRTTTKRKWERKIWIFLFRMLSNDRVISIYPATHSRTVTPTSATAIATLNEDTRLMPIGWDKCEVKPNTIDTEVQPLP